MTFAEVAVDAPVAPLRTFSYSVPSALDVRVGHVVRVPFGRQRLQGVVFSLPAAPAVPETRDILSVSELHTAADRRPASAGKLGQLLLPVLALRGRRADAPPGRPPAAQDLLLGRRSGVRAARRPHPVPAEGVGVPGAPRPRVGGAGEQGDGRPGRPALARLADRGLVVRSHRWAGAKVSRKTVTFVRLADAAVSSPDRLPPVSERAHRQTALLELLRTRGTPMLLSEARKEYGYAVNALLEKGWIERETVAVDRDPLAGDVFPRPAPSSSARPNGVRRSPSAAHWTTGPRRRGRFCWRASPEAARRRSTWTPCSGAWRWDAGPSCWSPRSR